MANKDNPKPILLDWYSGKTGLPLTVQLREYSQPSIWHKHCDFIEMVIVLNGSVQSSVLNPDSSKLLEAGDIIMMSQGTSHHLSRMRQLRHYNVLFAPSILESVYKDVLGMFLVNWFRLGENECSNVMHLPRHNLTGVVALLENMRNELLNRSHGWELKLFGYFYQLLGYIMRNAVMEEQQATQSGFQLGSALRYMEENCTKPLTMATLSNSVKMSESSFRHQFKTVTGLAPIDYLIRLRCRRAALSMFYSDHSITDIALESGFSDGNYFSRKFKEVTGYSPREFRRRCQEGNLNVAEDWNWLERPAESADGEGADGTSADNEDADNAGADGKGDV